MIHLQCKSEGWIGGEFIETRGMCLSCLDLRLSTNRLSIEQGWTRRLSWGRWYLSNYVDRQFSRVHFRGDGKVRENLQEISGRLTSQADSETAITTAVQVHPGWKPTRRAHWNNGSADGAVGNLPRTRTGTFHSFPRLRCRAKAKDY